MPTSKPRFIVDEMAGRLARWLRIAGYDTFHKQSISDGELIGRALQEKRIILTRDTRLSSRRTLPEHLLIHSPFLEEQLRQVFTELGLKLEEKQVFSRCSDCNQPTEPVNKQTLSFSIPPYVYQHQEEFFSCPACGKILWKGSHWGRVLEKLKKATQDSCPGSEDS